MKRILISLIVSFSVFLAYDKNKITLTQSTQELY